MKKSTEEEEEGEDDRAALFVLNCFTCLFVFVSVAVWSPLFLIEAGKN
jgi:hypothetical protein